MSATIALSIPRTNQNMDWWLEDFLNGATGLRAFANSSSGGSSNVNEAPTTGDRRGITTLSTGTTGSVDQRGGLATSLATTILGGGYSNLMCFGIKPGTLHDNSTLQGWYRFGFSNVISTAGTETIEIRSVNGGNYEAISMAGGVATNTTTDLGVAPVSGTWQDFAIEILADASAVRFYRVINNALTLVATHTQNITTNVVGMRMTCHRSSATATAITCAVDYVGAGRTFGNVRWPRI